MKHSSLASSPNVKDKNRLTRNKTDRNRLTDKVSALPDSDNSSALLPKNSAVFTCKKEAKQQNHGNRKLNAHIEHKTNQNRTLLSAERELIMPDKACTELTDESTNDSLRNARSTKSEHGDHNQINYNRNKLPAKLPLASKMSKDTMKTKCGIGPYRPEWLQRFATPCWMIFWLFFFSLLQGIISSGLVPSVVTSIERRYGFRSSVTGQILQWADIGYVISCAPISYFGGRHSKPLFVGIGLICFGCGTFVFSLPQIISDWHVRYTRQQYIGTCLPLVDMQALSNFSVSVTAPNNKSWADQSIAPHDAYSAALLASSKFDSLCDPALHLHGSDAIFQKLQRYRFILMFCFAQLLMGIGSAPLFSLAVSYIDENVKPTKTAHCLAIFYTGMIFGPLIGFSTTAISSHYHVDTISLSDAPKLLEYDENDPNWVGLWWLGFVVFSGVCLIMAFPILTLPRVLPGAEKYQKIRLEQQRRQRFLSKMSSDSASMSSGGGEMRVSASKMAAGIPSPATSTSSLASISSLKNDRFWHRLLADLKHIPAALMRVLTNASYMFLTLSASVDGLIIGGLVGFMPKYLEKQFSIPTSQTNLMIGFIMVPFAGAGVLSSGHIVNRFQLTNKQIIKYCIFMSVCTALLAPMFLIYCKPSNLVGVQIGYDLEFNMTVSPKSPALQSNCNAHCKCVENSYNPVCASSPDGRQLIYFSSCFAGCPEPFLASRKAYNNCTCPPENSTVSGGVCQVQCPALTMFLILFAPTVFCTFSVGVPALTVVLKIVDYNERPFALGIQWILIRCLGMIPAPALIAWIFEMSCLVSHKKQCDSDDGFCSLYDNKMLADLFVTFGLILKAISSTFLVLALIFVPPNVHKDGLVNDLEGKKLPTEGTSNEKAPSVTKISTKPSSSTHPS